MTDTPAAADAAGPAALCGRRWPAGFDIRPWRFLTRLPVWRALVWTLLLAVLFLPCFVAAVVLLPWLPLSARASDVVGRTGARWMRVAVPRRRVGRWFDWPQAVDLVAQLVLAFAAFVLTLSLGVVTVFLAGIPFFYRESQDGVLSFGFWETGWPPAVFGVCWLLTFLGALVFLYASWLLTGCSVAATVLSNTPAQDRVADLTRSRAVLTDAFTGERRRIERELHDGPQQYLTALQLNVATAELTATRGGDISAELADIRVNARQALDALRTTVRGIYPQVLADKGLIAALQELTAHAGVDSRVVDERTPDSRQLTDTPALLLYHCAAEGMTNAVRHGSATAVQVTVRDSDGPGAGAGSTVLTVDDNGSGLSESPAAPGSGSTDSTGIAGLRERAATLGGTLSLSSSPDAAWTTRLEMRLP